MSNSYYEMVKDADVDALCELGTAPGASHTAQAVNAAFQRLQTIAMQDAAKAQIEAAADQKEAAQALIRAAVATEETAEYTKNSAWWLMWSAIFLALSFAVTVGVSIWDHVFPAVTTVSLLLPH